MVPFLARCLLYTKSRQSAKEKTKPMAVDNCMISKLDGACRNQKLAQKELCCMVNQEASMKEVLGRDELEAIDEQERQTVIAARDAAWAEWRRELDGERTAVCELLGDMLLEIDRYREAQEAYDVLKDDQKRSAYDQFGHAATGPGARGPAGFDGDVGDIFGDMFGDIFGNFAGDDLFSQLFGGGGGPVAQAAPAAAARSDARMAVGAV